MNDYSRSLISYSKGQKHVTVMIDHPPIREERKESIDYLRTHGCIIIPDVEEPPPWLTDLDRELQEEVVRTHLDLIPIYSVRIPETATIASKDLILLNEIQELKHLYIAHQAIEPKDLSSLDHLAELEVLTLIGEAFSNCHLAHLNQLKSLRAMDIQSTRVTAMVAQEIKRRFPNATIYFGSK